MIINPSKSRLMIFIISSLAFLIFTISVFIKSSFIALIDAAEQNLLANFTPAALLHLTTPFVMFSHGILFALLIFIFMFVLWGLKFKIPAAWILLTTLLGWLIVNVFSLIFNHQVAGQKTEYPAHTIFFATLLYFFLAKIVIPELKTISVSYTHLRAHETDSYLVCRLLLEKKKRTNIHNASLLLKQKSIQ